MITIITATYNASSTILECLESVGAQTQTCEHLIIDGASSDLTVEAVTSYTRHTVRLISEPDNGIYDAMNKGIALSQGEIIGILNADDFFATNDVLSQVSAQFADPLLGACYGDLYYVDHTDTDRIVRYWRSGNYNHRKFYWGWMPPHPTFFVRKSIYEQFGGFNLRMGSAADYELMLRFLVKHRVKAVYVPEVLVKMRTGGVSNATLKNRLLANQMDRFAWVINGLQPYPWTTLLKPLRKISQWLVKA
jgi:glycosyltransferase involved in cell wall biosynthesis